MHEFSDVHPVHPAHPLHDAPSPSITGRLQPGVRAPRMATYSRDSQRKATVGVHLDSLLPGIGRMRSWGNYPHHDCDFYGMTWMIFMMVNVGYHDHMVYHYG